MKYLLLVVSSFLLFSCKKKEDNDQDYLKKFQKEFDEYKEKAIDFDLNTTPKYFSATTIDGKSFNSKDHSGKNIVIFIYDASYLKKSESYNLSQEFNDVYNSFKEDAQFIGIIQGFVENEKDFNDSVTNSKLLFQQIDNTISQTKSKELFYNIVCTPAKILIDVNGKVISSTCGGRNTAALVYKLDSIKNANSKITLQQKEQTIHK